MEYYIIDFIRITNTKDHDILCIYSELFELESITQVQNIYIFFQ